MRQEDINKTINEGLADTLLIPVYMKKSKTQKELLDILNEIYVSYKRISVLIDDYYLMQEEKDVVNRAIYRKYLESMLATSAGLLASGFMGVDIKLDLLIISLNISLFGGHALCKANYDTMPSYTLAPREREILKKDYESEEKIITDLLNLYLYKIVDYLPYFSLNNRSFMDELKKIMSDNKNHIDSRINLGKYDKNFSYYSIYDMHNELFDGVQTFNNLIKGFKDSYDQSFDNNQKKGKKQKIRMKKHIK